MKTTKRFKIFKEGRTPKEGVVILSKEGFPFDETFKRKKYKDLGYTISEIN